MKRVISIALILCSLKSISLYAQTIGMYSTASIIHEAESEEKENAEEYKVRNVEENTPNSYDVPVEKNVSIPYYVPLEEIAERIEYIYACERMLRDNQFYDYRELGPLSEGNVQLSLYTVSGNKLLFLPEGMGNKEVLINDELCELYYSEDAGGFAFYYVADFRLDEGGVPVNVIGSGADEQGIRTCMIYYYDTIVKLGDIEVTFDTKKIDMPEIYIDENEYIESMVRSIQLTLAENEHYGNYEIYLGTYCRMPSEGTEESFLKKTAAKVTGCVVGEDLEQYFYFVIPDDTQKYSDPFISRAYDYYPPGYYGYEEVSERYFVGSLFMPTEEYEDCIQKIKDLGWIKISISVTEGEDYYVDINRERICEENTERTEESIDAEEALDVISYACSYSEWFGMNELGYMEGEIRGINNKEIVIYKESRDEDILYFIPREKVNRTVQGDNGTIYLYINTEGMAEFYAIYRNSFAEKEWHLKTTLCLTYTMDVDDACRLLCNIGGGNLKVDDLTLSEVPKVENDEYVEALENHITELLKQNGNSGEYKMYIGEYEAFDYSRMCISAAVVGSEEYYFRYLIVKSQKGNYYFWPVGFGLNGSLEECEADRHYMNSVCIDRTIQLGRTEIVLDIEPGVSLLKLEEMLENNLFENVSFLQSENAIAFYETHVHTPFDGYQIPIYRETSEKDILFEGTFLVEKDTGDIYIRGEKEWVLLKEGILKGLNLPDEPEDVFMHEYDGDNEVIVELLDKVFDFLKTEKEYANFKIKYDGVYSFLGRKYHSVSLIENINDDMIHTLQRYSVDMETGALYQESDPEERKELYYMGNLGIEQEAAEAGTEDIEYVNKVIPVQYTNDLSYLADMKYTNSTYAYQDGKIYYRRYHEDSYEEAALWGEYDAIPETKKEMVCVDADGVETVLFTDEGDGDIYLLNNRFYLTKAERKESAYGYTYTARCLYSVNMQGNKRIDYGEGYVFAIDKERKIIIMQLREESGICYYVVNYETGKKERLCFEYPFDSGAYQDGWFYYERHTGDDITCNLCAVSLEGEEREIIALTSDGSQVPNVREHISEIKVDENRIYFIFGGCDGSLQVFQGGKLISVKLDRTDYRAVETERDAFYLSHDKGKSLVYFVSHYNAPLNENDAMVWDVEENICYRSDFPADTLNYYEKGIYKDRSIYKNVERMWRYYPAMMGALYSVTRYDSELRKQKEDIYAIPDDSGKIVRVVTDIEQYITKWEEEEASYIDYEDFYFADGYLYFKVEYSVYDEGTSIGWRDGLRRLHVDICRLKIGESKAEILYSY